MGTRSDKEDPARVLRQRVIQTMAQHNRCDVEISTLLRDWENQWGDDLDAVEDFKAWCRRRGWKVGRGVTVPRFIVTK